ncbi:sulfite exporter TauE/SafE family protein [Idiomarina aquatica]|nr:sulfite exporter TauE/SafE family protein [Idiomarina aquatica]
MNNVDIVTAFIMGLAGAGHCLAMCGGIASAIGVQTRWSNIVLYNIGRMASYVLLGAIVGGAVALIAPDSPHTTKVLRWLAVLFLLALGLYFTGWWPILNKLEQAAKPLWNRVKGLAPAQTGGRLTVFLAGAVWGWLPCGLVYSALSYAAVSGDALQGGLLMAAFAIGTFPAMVGAGYFSQAMRSILQAQGFRLAIGVLLMIYALWTALTLIRPHF